MAYVLGQDQKPRKQNRKRPENTTDVSSENSTPLYSYEKVE